MFNSLFKKQIPELEVEVLKYWKSNNVFESSVNNRDKLKKYVMYDGPPFATGLPHYGNMLPHVIKDVIPRYQTMLGFRVERRFGWDCHGVPVEMEIQKQHKLSTHQIDNADKIAEFNEQCRSIVLRYTEEWKYAESRVGRFVDMENDYKTMNPEFMESVWAVFKKLHEKSLVYKENRVLAYSPLLGTPLSDFESKLNYKDVQDPSVVMSIPLLTDKFGGEVFVLVWTTTPWSIPANVAIALNKDIEYVLKTTNNGKSYIVCKDSASKYFKLSEEELKDLTPIKSEDLIGLEYNPIFSFEKNEGKKFTLIESGHVKSSEGTGFVHIAPAHGEDDYVIGKKFGLPVIDNFDMKGCFNDGIISEISGVFFKTAEKKIITYLENKGYLFQKDHVTHSYPMCWRTDSPLMFRAIPSWYVKVEAIKDRLIENNKLVNWYPKWVGEKKFHNWLENARDWSVSRNRFWGTPIPIWVNEEDSSDIIVIGSREELKNLTGTNPDDLHRHFIDDIIIKKDGKVYKRVKEVFDCWFESGAMPYAQINWPFCGDEKLEENFPANFIAEGLDQTRGWFYTLMVLSTALFDKPAFNNVIVNGIVLGNDGQKMSKRLKNYPELNQIFTKYGADSLRYFLLNSPGTQARDVSLTEQAVKEVSKNILIPINNSFIYFEEICSRFSYHPKGDLNLGTLSNPQDKWLIYRVELFKKELSKNLNGYELSDACKEIQSMIDDLSKWYIRTAKHRASEEGLSESKKNMLEVLCYAFKNISMCIAPVVPFVSEAIYSSLNNFTESVHLQFWPKEQAREILDYCKKEYDNVNLIRKIIYLGNVIRNNQKIRVRQPLQSLILDNKYRDLVSGKEQILLDELNIIEIKWSELSDSDIVDEIKLNAKVLWPKFKGETQSIIDAVSSDKFILNGKNIHVLGHSLEQEVDFIVEKKLINQDKGLACATQDGLTVIMDIRIDQKLNLAGIMRDFSREINKLRKTAGYLHSDIVDFHIRGTRLRKLLENTQEFQDLLKSNLKNNYIFADDTGEKQAFICSGFKVDEQVCGSIMVVEKHSIEHTIHHSSSTSALIQFTGLQKQKETEPTPDSFTVEDESKEKKNTNTSLQLKL